jgi:hypothetical protein
MRDLVIPKKLVLAIALGSAGGAAGAGCSPLNPEAVTASEGTSTGAAATSETATSEAATSEVATSEVTSAGASSGDSEGEEESTSGSTSPPEDPCTVDRDCGDSEICVEGRCEIDGGECGDVLVEISARAPKVMLVLDKSGSMVASKWDGDNDPNTAPVTRWYSLHQAVSMVATEFNASIDLGLQLFPSLNATQTYNNSACLVEVVPEVHVGPENAEKVLGALPPASAMAQIAGATPSRLGIESAAKHLEGLADEPWKAIIFVTDGAANCALEANDNMALFESYDEKVLDAVLDAFSKGIGVFVVGIETPNEFTPLVADGHPDGINPTEKLNELAVAGGFPKENSKRKFHHVANQIQLEDALSGIVRQMLTCEVDLDPPPVWPDHVEITLKGVKYPSPIGAKECDSEDGWYYSSPEMDRISLCGAACGDFQRSGGLDALYRCPPSE